MFLSCSTVNQITSFYQGKDTIIYFIRPTNIIGDDIDCSCDFTIKKIKEKIQSVVFNFTVEYDSIKTFLVYKNKFYFVSLDSNVFLLQDVQILFTEISNNKIRYTSVIPPFQFNSLINSKSIKFIIENKKTSYQFKPSGSFLEAMKKAKLEFSDYHLE
jgi:hypothetical protein